ncbi:MAG TPA: signal peptidase II [Candidatus Polarisedimenticolia bacterium]|nr:signal peptidase II [Candidatus Polarisedimenticolia bacterium]
MSGPSLIRVVYGLITLSVFGFDQWTKDLITSHMSLSSSIAIVPGLFHLTLVTNRGALFGLFHDLPDPYRGAIFTIIPGLAILLILAFQYATGPTDALAQVGLSLILGGAVGNLVDRLRFGYVVDFLDVFVKDHHWPAFNVADSAICIGVSLLVLDLLRKGRARSHGAVTGA